MGKICVVMNSLLIEAPTPQASLESRKPFSVAVIYDTPLAHEQVDRVYSNILKKFGAQESATYWWSFAELDSSDQGDQSATLAADSDLLIIATVTGHDLPLRIKGWIERWLSKLDDRERALAVLVGVVSGQDQTALPVRQYLQHVADGSGLAFFVSSFVLPDLLEELLARSEYKCVWLADMLRSPPPSRWGINE